LKGELPISPKFENIQNSIGHESGEKQKEKKEGRQSANPSKKKKKELHGPKIR